MGGGSSGFLNFSLPLTVTSASFGCWRTLRVHVLYDKALTVGVLGMCGVYIGEGVSIWACGYDGTYARWDGYGVASG